MGTASYMSPEQARGKPVDKQTDIWAFGCCLYEALTGKRAFDGETVTDILAAVVKTEPDWSLMSAAVPSNIAKLVRRALSKNKGICLPVDEHWSRKAVLARSGVAKHFS